MESETATATLLLPVTSALASTSSGGASGGSGGSAGGKGGDGGCGGPAGGKGSDGGEGGVSDGVFCEDSSQTAHQRAVLRGAAVLVGKGEVGE